MPLISTNGPLFFFNRATYITMSWTPFPHPVHINHTLMKKSRVLKRAEFDLAPGSVKLHYCQCGAQLASPVSQARCGLEDILFLMSPACLCLSCDLGVLDSDGSGLPMSGKLYGQMLLGAENEASGPNVGSRAAG